MTRYLLDTNIVSYFVKGVNPGLVARMERGFRAQNMVISCITRAEVRYGAELMDANDRRRARIDIMLDDLLALPWSVEAADLFGSIKASLRRQGIPIGDFDTQIAAHALAADLTLVTHNTRHFERIPGLKLEDWMV